MAPGGRQGILSLTIKDENALYAAYMQFVKNGGLFIPTNKKYKIGDEVFMLLTLMQVCRYLVKDFGTSQSPKSTRQRDSRYCPD
ncbi:MAG: hypothetical protein AB2813_00425, partial [Candidatus Sedimenticola endophacoides]